MSGRPKSRRLALAVYLITLAACYGLGVVSGYVLFGGAAAPEPDGSTPATVLPGGVTPGPPNAAVHPVNRYIIGVSDCRAVRGPDGIAVSLKVYTGEGNWSFGPEAKLAFAGEELIVDLKAAVENPSPPTGPRQMMHAVGLPVVEGPWRQVRRARILINGIPYCVGVPVEDVATPVLSSVQRR